MSAGSEMAPLGRGSSGTSLGGGKPTVRGLWVLSRLSTREAAGRRAFRGARASGVLVALSTALLVAVLGGGSAADVTDILALRALAYASWLFGALGLWVFCGTDPRASSALAAERGFDGEAVSRAWLFGVTLRIALGVFVVTLVPLALSIASSPTAPLLIARLTLLPAVALYSLLFGVTMALLGRMALVLAPEAPRLLLVLVVLLPYVASLWFTDAPSVPGAFGFLIERMIELGGAGL